MPVQCSGLIFTKLPSGAYQVAVGHDGTDNSRVERVVTIPSATWATIVADAVGTARQKLAAHSQRNYGDESF